jgi:CMP-N-acetylneuraminic acid synthetase
MKTGGRICIIPARGGSKRIPRKKIRLLAGIGTAEALASAVAQIRFEQPATMQAHR